MTALAKLTVVETKLFFREPLLWLIALLLPTAVLLILGASMGTGEPDPALGGYRFLDVFVPSLIVLTIATLAIHSFATPLATYREKGILRRLATAPVRPESLIVAQVGIRFVGALASIALLVVAANVVFGVPLPKNLPGFLVATTLGMSAMFAIALLIAAITPTTGAANAIGLPVFFAVMFVGGVYLPRVFLPEIVNEIGRFTPPGVQGITEAWLGAGPDPLPLAVMAATTVVASLLAARLFRWQ